MCITFPSVIANEDPISFMAFVAQTPPCFIGNKFDEYSVAVNLSVLRISNENLDDSLAFYSDKLAKLSTHNYFDLKKYKIFVKDVWFFKVLLLNSLRYLKCSTVKLHGFIRCIIDNIHSDQNLTIHLLRILEIILKKDVSFIDEILAECIIQCMTTVAIAPFHGFKYYANSISRYTLKVASKSTRTMLMDLNLIPIKGTDTADLIKYASFDVDRAVGKILRLFGNNIENRDGSFLYEDLVKMEFDDWKLIVWPQFYGSFNKLEHEGEYFQSLIKYWLPITVKKYQYNFYDFIKQQPIEDYIKAATLYEVRRQGFYITQYDQDTLYFVQSLETADVGLKIASIHVKKSSSPSSWDLKCVQVYLESCMGDLNDVAHKSLKLFFSHLFFYWHRCFLYNKVRNKELQLTEEFLDNIFIYVDIMFDVNYEVATEILQLILDVALGGSRNLQLMYNLEKNDHYSPQDNSLYKYLLTANKFQFSNQYIIDRTKNAFQATFGYGINLTRLISRHFLHHISEDDILNTLNSLPKRPNLHTCEMVHHCAQLLSKRGVINTTNVCSKIFHTNAGDDLFMQVLTFECLLVDLQNGNTPPDIKTILNKGLNEFLANITTYGSSGHRSKKIAEAFINNVLQCMMLIKLDNQFDYPILLNQLITIVGMSNMKKPVTLAIKLINSISQSMEQYEYFRTQKINFLSQVLENIYETPSELNVTIRRNPESRLVVHAFCSSEYLLSWCMDFLLNVLNNKNAPDSSISSALHCIELLISDNNLQNQTLQYIPRIIEDSVLLFQKKNWSIRNGDLQVVKALIERFLGVSISQASRPKTVEDLFAVFPHLESFFYQYLDTEEFTGSSVIVCLFFCESQFKNRPFAGYNTEKFVACFFKILQKEFGYHGHLAILSLVAMCVPDCISRLFDDIVEYLLKTRVTSNVLKNFLTLLNLLYQKYCKSFECPVDLNRIGYKLRHTLTSYPNNLLNMILCKVDGPKEIIAKQNGKQCSSFVDRLWFFNNIPFLFNSLSNDDFPSILQLTLQTQIPDCIQTKVLIVILEKHQDGFFTQNSLMEIVKILLKKLLGIEHSKYMVYCYFQTILVLWDDTEGTIFEVPPRQFYQTTNFCKIMALIMVLSRCTEKLDEDSHFICTSVEFYKYCIFVSDDIAQDVASTLNYLYSCTDNVEDTQTILKMAFCLLLRVDTSLEICKFWSIISKKPVLCVVRTVGDFLKRDNLKKIFGVAEEVDKFLVSVYDYTVNLQTESKDSGTFYLIEDDYSVPLSIVLRLCLFNMKAIIKI